MFCHNCGKKVKDGAKHCPYCGVKLFVPEPEETAGNAQEQAQGQPGNVPGGPTEQRKKQEKRNNWLPLLIVGAALLFVVLFAAGRLTGGKNTLKPVDYVELQVGGLDTEGKAYITFDMAGFLDAVAEKKDLTEREREEIVLLLEDVTKDFSLSAKTELSNGDEITIKSNVNKNLLKEYGILLKNGSVKRKVEGLPEIQEVDLGAYASVAFSGFAGDGFGYVSVDYEKLREDVAEKIRKADTSGEAETFIENELSYYLGAVTVSPSSMEDLEEGEAVSFELSISEPEITEYGIRFTGQELTAEAEGLVPVSRIDLADYLDCSFSGYNGAGTASPFLQEEQLASDLQELFETQQRGAYGALQETADLEQEVSQTVGIIRQAWSDSFSTTMDQSSGLKNGDEVTILAAGVEEESLYCPAIGIYLEGGSKTVKAEGLPEPEEIDLAEALTVTFSGICPNVYVERTVDYDVPYYGLTSLGDLDDNERILAWNGDEYSGQITYDAGELLENGYVVSNDRYSYTISGLNSYRLSADTLEAESLSEMKETMNALAVDQIAQNRNWIKDNLESEERWILWADSVVELYSGQIAYVSGESSTQNRVYLVYQGRLPVKKLDHTVTEKDVYFVSCCYNVQETPEGSLLYEDYDTSLFLSEAEAKEYIRSDGQKLGEQAEFTPLGWSGEREQTELSLNAEEAVSNDALTEDQVTLQPAEIASGAAGQAAKMISYEGHTYARYDRNLTWELARSFCEKAGGHLATVTSDRENAVIQYLLEDAAYDRYWLGATDEEWEGGWQWITGEAFDWTDWDGNQPDNNSGNEKEEENYLEIGSRFGGRWNDVSGSLQEGGFILEMEPAALPDADASDAEAGQDAQEGTETARTDGESVYLTDLTASYMHESGLQNYVQDPYGESHFYSLYLNASERAAAYYELNGAYSELTGTISTWTEADSEGVYELAVWGDDQLLFSLFDYQKADAPVSFRIDVKGVETLSIQTRNRGAESNGYLFLNEGKLYSDGTETMHTGTKKSLTDLNLVDGRDYRNFLDNGLSTDSGGRIYRELNGFLASENGQAVWRLDGRYQSLSGILFAGEEAYNQETSVSVEILADGEQVFLAEELDVFQGRIPVSVDLEGAETLTIRTWSNGEGGEQNVYLGDTVLTGTGTVPETQTQESRFPELDPVITQKAARVVTSGDYRYYRFDEPLTWQQAEAFCRAAGGMQASPKDAQQNEAVRTLISDGLYNGYWLGGQRENRTSGGAETDATAGWRWSDGTVFGEYQNWAGGRPDNYEGKEYLLAMYGDGTWDDWAADARTGFVMEVSAVSGLASENDVALSDFEWTDSQNCEYRDANTKNGFYPASVRMDASNDARFSISLDGAYTAFQGRLHPYIDAADDVNFQVGIFGDGRLLYELRDGKKTDPDTEFTVNVSGVQQLTVATRNNGGYSNGFLYLLGGRLTAAEEPEEQAAGRLAQLVAVDAVECDQGLAMFQDAYDQLHDGYTAFNAGAGGDALYNLGGSYTSFSGTITAGSDTLVDVPVKITFYADGTPVYEIEAFEKSGGPVPFTVDVTGASTLEIRAEARTDGAASWVYLTDEQLSGNE